MTETDLSKKMRALAEGHPRSDELLEKAQAFDVAANGFYADPQTVPAPKFLGAFARAKMLWCEITGEFLV